ncbi:MAG: LysR family transcriptional regulator [Cyclobacteriaceae bacterium]
MINLEWLRTFRAVYKTKSLSKASEMLKISQPTVSQHLVALEARMGKKLFVRKSKGVSETDEGRMLNTLVAGSMESLENAESMLTQKDSQIKNIVTIGISEHLYKTLLCNRIVKLGSHVHVKFGKKADLIKDVEQGNLLYAIIPDKINTFDTLCFPITKQKVVLAGTPDINFSELKLLYAKNKKAAQRWLSKQTWYAHDINSSFIKIYWLTVFDKTRPAIIPNYIIPNEYEVLFQQSNGSGVSVAFDSSVKSFVKDGKLQVCELKSVEYRELSLIANKQKSNPELTAEFVKHLKGQK